MKIIALTPLLFFLCSFAINAQQTKTLFLNANDQVLNLVLKGDSVIAGGEFTLPYTFVAGVHVASGEVFPLGDGLPDTVRKLFFIPWKPHILCAATSNFPYLYNYDFNALIPEWTPDTFFNVSSRVNDVDTLPDRVVLATDAGTLIIHEGDTSEWFPITLAGDRATNVEFNHTSNDGTLYTLETTGTWLWDWFSKLYKISLVDSTMVKTEVPLGFVTCIYSAYDMEWFQNKLIINGEIAIIPDNGIHPEIVSLTPGGTWQTVSFGSCPHVKGLSVNHDTLYITGSFNQIKDTEVGPVVAKYYNLEFTNCFPTDQIGLGLTIETEPEGKWTALSGLITTSLNPTYGKTQILVFGNKIPSVTSIAEIPPQSLSIFPNPTHSEITLTGKKNAIIHVSDVTGKIYLRTRIESNNQTFDLSTFPSGMYFIAEQGKPGQKLFVTH